VVAQARAAADNKELELKLIKAMLLGDAHGRQSELGFEFPGGGNCQRCRPQRPESIDNEERAPDSKLKCSRARRPVKPRGGTLTLPFAPTGQIAFKLS
jgi:hypothetical protein